MIVYNRLWLYMRFEKRMSKYRLLDCISSPTLAKLSKNENVDISTINKICSFLQCQPSDIMEYVPDCSSEC